MPEDEWLPIAALQHYAFCPRQWGLIHLEGQWADNRLTAEGGGMHDRTDQPGTESRGDLRIARALAIRCRRLGLTGKADVVEFHRQEEGGPVDGPAATVLLDGVDGRWRPIPVEYKRGAPKPWACDDVQVCAQALCLEEMLGVSIPLALLYYGAVRRRQEVPLTPDLRARTEALVDELHQARRRGVTPAALDDARCERCSMKDLCLPRLSRPGAATVDRYMSLSMERAEREGP